MSEASKAPERIWTCAHVGEYGSYFAEAVEAEGEYGGSAVEYIRADIARAAPTVNPLEWHGWRRGAYHHTWNSLNVLRETKSVFGSFFIGRKYSHTKAVGVYEYSDDWWAELPWQKELLGPFAHDVDAIKAVNDQYERRILSALK